MDQQHDTTETRKKGSHLSYDDRFLIQIRLKDKRSIRSIAREILCSPATVINEIRRGTVSLYNGKVKRYSAKAGQKKYEANRSACCRHYDAVNKAAFLSYTEEHCLNQKWSPDACAGHAIASGLFQKEQTVCTKTLYNYIEKGLIRVKNIDLPLKLRRSKNVYKVRANKRKLGRSIEERPESVLTREEFGHWECDLVIGSKSGGDSVLLTMLERRTREFWLYRIPDKQAESVLSVFRKLQEDYGDKFSEIFKTVTTDNGSEFAGLSDLEKASETLVYYAHPYSSCEKGSVENHNGLIRRFIPKGKAINGFNDKQISLVEAWCNSLPRKILGYKCPCQVFEEELGRIYGTTA